MRRVFLLFAFMLTCGASARDFRICVDANDWALCTRDGDLQTPVRPAVARQGDYEIAARLEALGIPDNDEYRSDENILKALLAGRANVAVLFPNAARRAAESLEYQGKVEVMTPPFGRIFYYIAFAKPVYEANREAIERLWRIVAEMRAGAIDPGDGGRIVSPRTNGEHS
jgi:hypothetical protein